MKIDDASEQDFLEVYLIITGINQAAKVSMQMNRNVNALNATDVPSTLRRGNFKTEVSLWKRMECSSSTLCRRNFKTQQFDEF